MNRNLMVLLLIVPLLLAFTYQEQHEQMLYPTVRVRSANVGGSGTVVWSGMDKEKKIHTFVLTNYHVIATAIEIKEVWDPALGKKINREYRQTVMVERFSYNNFSHNIGSLGIQADVVVYDEREDIALLELRDRETQYPYVAKMFPGERIEDIHIYDKVWAVGAALGHPPISTHGILNYLDDEIDKYNYWLSSAATIYGNSGGAVYRYSKKRKQFEYIGIPSRIAISASFFSQDAITHLGFLIPITRLLSFLERTKYRFIYDDTFSYDREVNARNVERQRRDRLREFYEIREASH